MKLSASRLVSALLAVSSPVAARAAAEARDLAELSLEELSTIEVTSVSKKREPLADAAAAVALITNEDLRRSGARTIPEALRLVPGLHVGQISSSAWEVSARGFSSLNSGKLLVLSDTRNIYTPLYSGVFWDVQDLLLEDVDRIEVIRGPGASLWGSNAVNGVINITTKSAKETQGAYFEGGGGTKERGFGAVRYGGQLADGLYFRVFAKGMDRTGEFAPSGPSRDNWKLGHFGFRADWDLGPRDTLTFQGDAYAGTIGQVSPSVVVTGRPGPTGKLLIDVAGGNVLGRWTHTFAPGSELQFRAYYDSTHRDDPTFVDDLNTVDLDLQHRFRLPLKQEILWGFNYRSVANQNEGKGLLALDPPRIRDDVFSGFVQDQIAVLDSLKVTLGTKVEHDEFSAFEIQPTARAAWSPIREQTLWGAVSRAVRVPTRLERDIDITASDPSRNPVVKLLGSRSFHSEELIAYEAGYRWQIRQSLFVDLAAYYNVYRGLASLEQDPPFVDPQTGQSVLPLVNRNLTDGVAKGGEASLSFNPARAWRMVANYAYVLLTIDPKGRDLLRGSLSAGSTPRNQVEVQSYLDLPGRFQLDAFFRYASSLPAASQLVAGQDTPAYATVDARVAWQGQRFEVSLVGRNLVQAHHREFPGGTEVERAVYGKIAGRF
jgi:iron complex outermembrane receptor protein